MWLRSRLPRATTWVGALPTIFLVPVVVWWAEPTERKRQPHARYIGLHLTQIRFGLMICKENVLPCTRCLLSRQ